MKDLTGKMQRTITDRDSCQCGVAFGQGLQKGDELAMAIAPETGVADFAAGYLQRYEQATAGGFTAYCVDWNSPEALVEDYVHTPRQTCCKTGTVHGHRAELFEADLTELEAI